MLFQAGPMDTSLSKSHLVAVKHVESTAIGEAHPTLSARLLGAHCLVACRQTARPWHKTVHMPLEAGYILKWSKYVLAKMTFDNATLKYYAGKMEDGTQSAILTGTRTTPDTSISEKDWIVGEGGRMTIHELKLGYILPTPGRKISPDYTCTTRRTQMRN